MKISNKSLAISAVLLLLFPTLFFSSFNGQSTLTANAQQQSIGFQIINAVWGTTTATAQAGPGDLDVPLTLTLQYLYPYMAISTELEIELPPGFNSTTTSGGGLQNNATVYYPNKILQGQIFQVTIYLNLSPNLTLGKYEVPTSILWYAILSNTTSMPEVYLKQNTNFIVSLNGHSKLVFSTPATALVPGEVNYIPLTLANSGSGNVSDISTTISTSNNQFASVLNQIPIVGELPSNSNLTATVQLYVSASALGSPVSLSLTTTFLDPYGNEQSATQILGLFVSSVMSGTQLEYRVLQSSLFPGEVNNITLVATNNATEVLSDISTQISTTSQSVSILSQPKTVDELTAGTSAMLYLSVFVAASGSNTPITLTLASTYVEPSGVAKSFSENIGLYISSASTVPVTSSISVTAISNYVTAGQASSVSFLIKNAGTTPIYNPTFSLSATTPLVVSTNSTYWTPNGSQIGPNNSVIYEAMIISSPSATVGAYSGSLTVSYSNQYGISNAQTVQVGFFLTGTIDLVIQNELISQGSSNLTVSGTLLNEGTVSAYYASVVGYSEAASSSVPGPTGPLTYVGEIDPNTPVPFVATMPYALGNSPSKANVTLLISYRDSFGRDLTFENSTTTTLLSASQLAQQTQVTTPPSPSGQELVMIVLFAIIVVIVLSVVVGVFVIRRRRRYLGGVAGGAKGESREGEESKVV